MQIGRIIAIGVTAAPWLVAAATNEPVRQAVWIEREIPANEISVSASSQFSPQQSVRHLVDGSGIQSGFHDNDFGAATMWHTVPNPKPEPLGKALPSSPAWVRFEFAWPEKFDVIRIWNHNQMNLTDRGFRKTRLYGSGDGRVWFPLTSPETVELPRATGDNGEEPVNVANAAAGRPIKWVIIAAEAADGNYGGDCFGLSAVRFIVRVAPTNSPLVTPTSWTCGRKMLLFIRIDFPDLPGEPAPREKITTTLEQVDAYFQRVSYGKLSIKSTVTSTLRMPRTVEWYEHASDQEQIIRDARSAAERSGFEMAGFDLDIVAFKTPEGGDSGVGAVGGKGLRLLNNFRFGVIVHELGHNFGLPHTSLWQTPDGSIIGPGKRVDMGDPYDPMGGGGDNPLNDFSIRSKSLLGWLGQDGICNVTSNGTYRVFAHDMPGAEGHVLGLRIARDSQNIYWVEFRQRQTDNPYMMNGARILRSYSYNNELDLLDMTPKSPLGAKDAPLVLGQTFSDLQAGLSITPLRKGHTSPESLDIVVRYLLVK